MAWSRQGAATAGNGTLSTSQSDQSQQQSTNSSSTTNGTSTTNSSQTTNTSSQNMSDKSLQALETLIAQLMSGGTPQMLRDQAQRDQEIVNNQALRAGYTKEAAFNDAQGAMAQQLQRAMESSLPALVRAAEGAGTSQNSMRALLTQDALNRAAQSSSALGLDAAGKYGTISAAFSGILEALTRPDNSTIEALTNALNIAKGAVTESTQQTNGTSTTNSSQTTNSQSNTNTNSQGNNISSVQPMTNLYGQTGGAQSILPMDSWSGSSAGNSSDSAWQNISAQELASSLMGGSDWDDYSF